MTPEGKVLAAAKRTAHALGCQWLRLSFLPGVAVGGPALMVLLPRGPVLFMECKAPRKTTTPMQDHRLKVLRELGFQTCVVDSADAASRAIASALGTPP